LLLAIGEPLALVKHKTPIVSPRLSHSSAAEWGVLKFRRSLGRCIGI
jgi:hypothetical protein